MTILTKFLLIFKFYPLPIYFRHCYIKQKLLWLFLIAMVSDLYGRFNKIYLQMQSGNMIICFKKYNECFNSYGLLRQEICKMLQPHALFGIAHFQTNYSTCLLWQLDSVESNSLSCIITSKSLADIKVKQSLDLPNSKIKAKWYILFNLKFQSKLEHSSSMLS